MEVEEKPERGSSVSEARAPVPLRAPTLCSPSILPPVCPSAHTPVHLQTSSSEMQPRAAWRDGVGRARQGASCADLVRTTGQAGGWVGRAGPGVLSALHRPAGQGPRPALPAGCRGTPSPHPPASPGRRPGRALEVRAGLERQCTHFLCRPPPLPPDSTAPWTGEACFPLRPARPSGLGAGWPAGGLVRPRPGTPLRMCSGPRAARGRWSRVPQVRSCSLGSPGLCPIANQFPGPRLPVPVKRNTPSLV